ncbi:MAG: RodZ domain-containing protein [Burkholderiales bacterium]
MQPQPNDLGAHRGAERAIGEALGDRRRSLGLSIDDVALKLKFMPRQLESLEAGRFERLAGPAFVRGMIRSYARVIGLDAEPLLARLGPAPAASIDSLAELVKTKPIPISASRGGNRLYAALSLVILAVIAAVAWEWQAEKATSERMTFVRPTEPQALATVPVALAATKLAAIEPPAQPAQESAAAPEVKEPPASGVRRIALQFDREAWVQVRGRDGKVLLSQLNTAGTERIVEGRAPFDLVIGNAQHVRLRYDDRDVDLAPHVKIDVARLKLE